MTVFWHTMVCAQAAKDETRRAEAHGRVTTRRLLWLGLGAWIGPSDAARDIAAARLGAAMSWRVEHKKKRRPLQR